MMTRQRYADLRLEDVHEDVRAGRRLSLEQGRRLACCEDLAAVGALAHHVKTRRHGDAVTWVRNRHVNYTNVCANHCAFCAFRRDRGEEGGFTLTMEQMVAKAVSVEDAAEAHIVGGCHPDLGLAFFEEALAAIRERAPHLVLKAFTPVEIVHFATMEGVTTREVLARLKAAGLAMCPGGGAEIFHPEVRRRICPDKADADAWLRVMGEAHELGLPTNCTMLFGHLENLEHRLDHLDRLRRQQDATGGFNCFIPLPFLTKNSALTLPKGQAGPSGLEILRTIALSRLMLDNIPHVKAYWVMLGVKLAQVALHYGADDFDGTVVEEKIGHMAGADSEQGHTPEDIAAMIRDCGFSPRERDALFRDRNPAEASA